MPTQRHGQCHYVDFPPEAVGVETARCEDTSEDVPALK